MASLWILAVAIALPPFALAVAAWKRRQLRPALPLCVMLLGSAVWCAASVALHASSDLASATGWLRVEYVGVVTVPPAWLLFALAYTGQRFAFNRWAILFVAALPICVLGLVWTNDFHGLVWTALSLDAGGHLQTARGPAFWLWTAVAYTYLAISDFVLLRLALQLMRGFREQALVFLLAAAVPCLVNGLFLAGALPLDHNVDATPFALDVTAVILGWGMLRLRLLTVHIGMIPRLRERMVDSLSDGVLAVDRGGRILDLNTAAAEILRASRHELIGRPLRSDISEWAVRGHADHSVVRALTLGHPLASRHYELRASDLGDGDARVVVLSDVTARLSAEATLKEREERYRSAVDLASEVIFRTDRQGRWRLLNPAWTAITGFVVAESVGTWVRSYVHPDDRAADSEHFAALLSGTVRSVRYEVRYRTQAGESAHTGETRWLQAHARAVRNIAGEIDGITGTLTDVTDRKRLEAELARQAFRDSLTGLANRALFRDATERALASAQRTGSLTAVLFVDLDHFKRINDRFGHGVGDQVLVAIAERFVETVRSSDMVARLGGDEFALVLEIESGGTAAVSTAQRLLDALDQPVHIEDRDLFLSASIGIAAAQAGDDVDALMRNADMAMYAAKRDGRGRFTVFTPDLATEANAWDLETDLHLAIARRQLRLQYQPIVELASGRVTGFEALVRWQHPRHGLILPDRFIPLAEETGLIMPIGRWVLQTACQHASDWQRDAGGARVSIAVNVSGRQMSATQIVQDVADALSTTGLAPADLTLEITEGVLLHEHQHMVGRLDALKDLGVRLAIDDFGTGYSSLSYLQKFPFDVLKIDRSFVRRVTEKDGLAFTGAIVDFARVLGLETVAEGIEEPEQTLALLALGADRGQGFGYARPVEAANVPALIGSILINAHGVRGSGVLCDRQRPPSSTHTVCDGLRRFGEPAVNYREQLD